MATATRYDIVVVQQWRACVIPMTFARSDEERGHETGARDPQKVGKKETHGVTTTTTNYWLFGA